ncbi:MAG: polysaccharide biosynthesis C-terminal domain-containing protein [Betaproteobacteria bacterium]|nr:polysaccharide biosynthesis C-terminal domain-containing protein [Betaproteobacteria bacterium]
MLIGHTLKYLPAQLLSPAAQLVSMVLWTHWLAPAEMGLFTLVTVTQEMTFIACLGWFSVYTLRYLPSGEDFAGRRRYLDTENVIVLASVGGALLSALVTTAVLYPGNDLWPTAPGVALFFVTRAFNMHYAERARAQSAFLAYTLLQTAGPVGGLGLGLLAFQYFDASALVLLAAYSVAQALGSLFALPMLGMRWRLSAPDRVLLKAALAFGAPMLGLHALAWVAENYIRYLVQWGAGAAALGLMIVGWSLGRRCAAVASMLVATAAFPLASRLFNEGRRDEAMAQLSVNAALLLAVLAPVTVAVELLGPTLVALVVAPEYRETTTSILGLSMLGGMLRNLHLHVTDQVMVLELRLKQVGFVGAAEIVASVVASLFGLTFFGLHGAVIGQALGSLLTLGLSLYWVRVRHGFIWPWWDTARILLATAAMAAAIVWAGGEPTLRGLLIDTAAGIVSYALALAFLFLRELRQLLPARA